MQVAGSAVQTVVVTGTSTTYRCSRASNSSRKWPARPYSSSATIQSSTTVPRTATARTSSAAIRGLVRKGRSSGMCALSQRSFASGVGSNQGSGRNSWWSSSAGPAGVTPTRKTPTWQLSSLPSRPLCCRATPAECAPFLVKADSSTTPTVPTGEAGGRGGQLVGEERLGLGLHVVAPPSGGADDLLKARDVAVADQQGDRLAALALG